MIRLLLAMALLSSCGSTGNDGDGGKDGADGKSVVCAVLAKEDGKNYLSCTNPDGSVVEAEIKAGEPGAPGRDAIVASISCKYFWANEGSASEGQDIAYQVVSFADGSAVASLHTKYRSNSQFEFLNTTSAVWTKESGLAAKAPLESSMWRAELNGAASAKIFRKGVNQGREIACVSSNG